MTSTVQFMTKSHNGLLLQLLHFGCHEFGWTVDYILDGVSLTMLLLLMRQHLTLNGQVNMLSLMDKQMMSENIPWDEWVRINRMELQRYMGNEQ